MLGPRVENIIPPISTGILDGAKARFWKNVRPFTIHEAFWFTHHRAP